MVYAVRYNIGFYNGDGTKGNVIQGQGRAYMDCDIAEIPEMLDEYLKTMKVPQFANILEIKREKGSHVIKKPGTDE